MIEPEIILGPPGTGKTTTLLGIVDDELKSGTSPDRIAYVSFTRRAATEAQTRAKEKFSLQRKDLPWFRTLHSLCMMCLGIDSSAVFDGDRLQEFASYIKENITGRFSVSDGSYTGYERGDRMLFMDNLARVRQVSLAEQYDRDHDNIDWSIVERFSLGLHKFKEANQLVDYTDMLELFVLYQAAPPLDVLVVDEAQDLSRLQWTVVRELAKNCRRIVIAGDDDQAIFLWAGADVQTFINMKGQVRVLGQSWRTPVHVQNLANKIISRVSNRRPKVWSPRAENGRVGTMSDTSNLDWTGNSIMVLGRNQSHLYQIMDELKSNGVFYEHHGHPSIKKSLLDGIVTWELLRRGETVFAKDIRKVYDLMTNNVGYKRGFKSLAAFKDNDKIKMNDLIQKGGLLATGIWHEALDRINPVDRTYIVRCRRNQERLSQAPRVRVGTIHESKGGEADKVILLTDMAPRTYKESIDNPQDEARVWYVGATRARNELWILNPRTNKNFTVPT